MKVLFVASEAAPLAKVGGLADVVGSLPKSLGGLGHDVRLVIPKYGIIDADRYDVVTVGDNFSVRMAGDDWQVTLGMVQLGDGIKVYLVGNEAFFGSDDVYGSDDQRRFLFFCRAVFEMLPKLDWQPEIVHCHDWHTALIPLWLKSSDYRYASIFTIHNLAYQGPLDSDFLSDSELKEDWQSWPMDAPKPALNFMSQGILWADMVTTVSETYAREILSPEYGEGMAPLLRYREKELCGITNGLDYEEYNPATDHSIAANYDSSTLWKRVANKLALQRRAGLPEDADIPLIGMVSRLDEQKGFDIVAKGFNSMLQETRAQMVILGTGREYYQNLLKQAADRYPQRLAVFLVFHDALARLIYSGCDLFFMPSRFEPCGLGQFIAMRYGAVPVVRRTGGLAETVQDLTPDLSEGSGFVFDDYDSRAMLVAVDRAVSAYKDGGGWQGVIQRIMALDFSWRASARKYESLYRKVLEKRGYAEK